MPTPFTKIVPLLPLSASLLLGAQVQLLLPPLLAQITAMLSGAFGLGILKADLVAQFKASVAITLSFGDPIAALKASIAAILRVQASLLASLSLGIPPISIQVSASLKLIAVLQIKIGGINLLIDLLLAVKLPVVNLLAQLKLALSLGGVVLYYWSDQTTPMLSAQIAAHDFVGDGVAPPGVLTSGVMLVTVTPAAAAIPAFNFLFAPGMLP